MRQHVFILISLRRSWASSLWLHHYTLSCNFRGEGKQEHTAGREHANYSRSSPIQSTVTDPKLVCRFDPWQQSLSGDRTHTEDPRCLSIIAFTSSSMFNGNNNGEGLVDASPASCVPHITGAGGSEGG